MSILTNYLPEAYQEPLEELQDHVPPRPFSEVKARILKETGKTPEQLFPEIEEEAIASASIGQVHRARLADGTQVAVKVQHHDIEDIARVDLSIIKRLSSLLAWLFHIKGMDFLYTQIRRMIEEELDFRKEAEAMQRIAENLKEVENIGIPKVYAEFSGQRILTTQWHTGVKINRLKQLDSLRINREELAHTLVDAYSRMVFVDGFYHADPHPGNLLVEPDGKLILLDFGATGHLSENMRSGMLKLIESAVRNDSRGIIEACRQMGFLAEGREAEDIANKMVQAVRQFLQNEVELDGLNFKDMKVNPFENSLFKLIREIGLGSITGTIQVPKDYVLLNRMMTQLMGICFLLAPNFNPLEAVRPYAEKFFTGDGKDWVGMIRKMLQGTLTSLVALPDEVRGTLQQLRSGNLEVGNPDLRAGWKLGYLIVQQIIFLTLSLLLGWYWLEFPSTHPQWMKPVAGVLAILSALKFLFQLVKGNRIWRGL